MNDLSILYYTANKLPEYFTNATRECLRSASEGLPIVSVSQKPLDFGHNICIGDVGASLLNLYNQVLLAAKAATTTYVALCEDDCLYLPSHFTGYRPPLDAFGYNQNKWSVFAWDYHKPPILSNKTHRCVLSQCIAPRQLLIDALEERFTLVKSGALTDEKIAMHFAEPGRHESWLGVKVQTKVEFWAPEPTIIFWWCHPHAIEKLGKRKRHGEIRADRCEPWGTATDLLLKYVGKDEWKRQRAL